MSRVVLEARQLSKSYRLGEETIHALSQLQFSLHSGDFVAVMGPSGSGKSTLLHLLGLLDTPDEGEVVLEGQSTKALSDDQLTALRRDKLGFVFQSFELIPSLTAKENILLPAEVAGRRREGLERCKVLAGQLGIADRLNHRPAQLSGGQRQRIALARALINNPALVLADEPTGNLDSQTSQEVLSLLRRGVDEAGWTVIMVTHDAEAASYADGIIELKDGRIINKTGRALLHSTS